MTVWILSCVLVLGIPEDTGQSEKSPIYARNTIDIGMVVSDLERSVKFYRDDLGLVPASPPTFDVSADIARDAGLTDGKSLHVAVLLLGREDTATRLKLMSFPGAKKSDGSYISTGLGVRYLTLFVNDMKAMLERLKARSIPVLGKGPAVFPNGIAITLVRDPDGNFVEFVGMLPPPPAGFKPLFNGKNLEGWTPMRNGRWKVEDGAIVGRQGEKNSGGWLIHEGTFADFELRFRFRLSPGGNSGVAIRYPGPEFPSPAQSGYEFQVGDADPRFLTASIFGLEKAREGLLNVEGWNEGRLVAEGNRITTFINGKKGVSVESDRSARGRIALQAHGGAQYDGFRVEFRDIEIKER